MALPTFNVVLPVASSVIPIQKSPHRVSIQRFVSQMVLDLVKLTLSTNLYVYYCCSTPYPGRGHKGEVYTARFLSGHVSGSSALMTLATRADLFPEGRRTCEMQGSLPVSLGRLASPKGVAGHPLVGEQKPATLEAGEAWRVLLGEVASKSAFLGFHSFTKTLPSEPGYQQVEGIGIVSVGLSSTTPAPTLWAILLMPPQVWGMTRHSLQPVLRMA